MRLAVGGCLLMLASFCASADDMPIDVVRRESLVDLPAVVVAVECAPVLTEAGLPCETIHRDAVEALTKAGVAVHQGPIPINARHRPVFLTLRIAAAKFVGSHTTQLYAVTLDMQLVQDVRIPRRGSRLFPATTWSSSQTQMVGPYKVSELRSDAAAMIDEFIRQKQIAGRRP